MGQKATPWTDTLKDLRREASRQACPDFGRVQDCLRGRMGPEEEKLIRDHLAFCPPCSQEGLAYLEGAGDARAVGRAGRSGGPGSTRSVLTWLSAAALVAGFSYVAFLSGPDRPTARLALDEGAVRGSVSIAANPSAYQPSGTVVSPVLAVSWPETPNATSYQVALYDEGLNLLWSSGRVCACRAVLPPQVQARLAQGQRYRWKVEAFQGTEAVSTHFEAFTLAPGLTTKP